MSYFDEIFEKIKNEKNPHLQLAYIDEELSMPYLEKTFEAKLKQARQEVLQKLPVISKEVDVEKMIYDSSQVMQAIDLLKNSNIRDYIGLIEKYLCEENHELIKGMLILILIDQQYHDKIHCTKDGLEIEFYPTQIELPIENDTVQKMLLDIEEKLLQYPNLKTHCIDKLFEKAICKLPFGYDESDESMILKEVYTEILTAFQENQLLEKINT